MEKDPSPKVAVYLVWSPQRGAHERNVAEAATLMPDARVRHYWDGDEVVGTAFRHAVGMREPAWDVWMLFGPDATWEAKPPAPSWWEHQQGGLPEKRVLDGDRFLAKAQQLLPRQSAEQPKSAG